MNNQTLNDEIELMELDRLKSHEETREPRLREVLEELRYDGVLEYPVTVDRRTHVILDGHHRVNALKRLGYRTVPVRTIDYLYCEDVQVEQRQNCPIGELTKHNVVEMGQSKETFPYKSTRHVYSNHIEPVNVPLKSLR